MGETAIRGGITLKKRGTYFSPQNKIHGVFLNPSNVKVYKGVIHSKLLIYTDLQWILMRSVHLCPVYIDSQCTLLRSVLWCPMYIDVQCTWMRNVHKCGTMVMYTHVQCTLMCNVNWCAVYIGTQYTLVRIVYWSAVYTVVQCTLVRNEQLDNWKIFKIGITEKLLFVFLCFFRLLIAR